MKKFNCIVVFNEDKTKLLFCKRKKDPYKGLYNFVGGKVEKGEDGMAAAYRELYEETGIPAKEIPLFHFMDITYYYQDFILELYVGRLSAPIQLVEELNPLEWLSIEENFCDAEKFAGDQNIAHIVNVALKYPLGEKVSCLVEACRQKDLLCLGVDGCRGGWIAAIIEGQRIKIERFEKIRDIVMKYDDFHEFLIDMPIGFPSKEDDIRPDTLARRIVSPRTSTIFPVPCRAAVYADSEAEQIKKNKECLGKELAKQTCAIIPKMKELDVFLQEHEGYKNVIKESHPEVCFARLNGSVVMSNKAKVEGVEERICILRQYVPELMMSTINDKTKEFGCNKDDIIDAICLAVTGMLNTLGKAESIPENPSKDNTGLKMQMVIPRNKAL